MRTTFLGLVGLLMLAVLAQFFLAGRGLFVADFDAHRGLGYATILLAVAAVLVGALARMPGRVLATTGLVVGVLLLQLVLARLAHRLDDVTTGGVVLGLHALDGAVVVALLGAVLAGARRSPGTPADPAPARPGAGP